MDFHHYKDYEQLEYMQTLRDDIDPRTRNGFDFHTLSHQGCRVLHLSLFDFHNMLILHLLWLHNPKQQNHFSKGLTQMYI